ncbi:MAG: TatD family hydrolase [Minisyncoccia bacterium]
MEIRYIDAHCHLQFEQYAQDRESVIEQMREQGIAGIVVGCDLETSRQAVELAEKHEHLYASVGLHPNHAEQESFAFEAYRALAMHPKVVAIGECGLDFFRPESQTSDAIKKQKELFSQHVVLAGTLNKPLIIHARQSLGTQDAYHEVIAILKEAKQNYPNLRGDVHFFAGGVKEAEVFIVLGFTVSFTAVITFSRDYDIVLRAVPLTNMLVETDAPYVAPITRRGKRNDPLAVIDVVTKIAEIRGEDLEIVRATILATTKHLFALD